MAGDSAVSLLVYNQSKLIIFHLTAETSGIPLEFSSSSTTSGRHFLVCSHRYVPAITLLELRPIK